MSDFLYSYDEMEWALYDPSIFGITDASWDHEFEVDTSIEKSPQFMNNQDYTLNSPLISDELEAFRNFLTTGNMTSIYYTPLWKRRLEMLRTQNIDYEKLQDTALFHKSCAEYWLKHRVNTIEIQKLITSADQHAMNTFEIIRSYFQSWLGRRIVFQSKKSCREEILKYGAYMLDTSIMTWILNGSSEYECKHLMKQFKLTPLNKTDITAGMLYKSTTMGNVVIGNGIIYFHDLKMIWDRNMLLMFKDTSAARFQTLFAIQRRDYFKYQDGHFETIVKMYALGDHVLIYNSVNAYDVFGLVEPIASFNLSELARQFRPLIPMFPHFHQHIMNKRNEMISKNLQSEGFIDFLLSITDKATLLTVYGSFRHWGHPFVNYLEGLKALHENVTSTKNPVNEKEAELYASDLAFKILYAEFESKGKWFIDINLLDPTHALYTHVENNTWPSADVLINYPHEWHKLPLLKCWEIPEVVEPALIYSDKTHSITLDELLDHIRNHPGEPIPTRKVLKTLFSTPATNWPEFLKKINDGLLEDHHKVIGLKAKEREIKWKGRFFALMSWALREYFVFTEYLIKKHILPLFHGLTMADDQTALLKKMIKNSTGQGSNSYENITIANHIDYEKWNNFQRKESTSPVFKVMGQFFGLPNLFTRTHEFFEESTIYYRDRPDLMHVVDGKLENKTSQRVCWNGQKGGLEGLRQKGWSVLNLLVIERSSRKTNTQVKVLAQGDNQVICTFYKLSEVHNEEVIQTHLAEILANNDKIINEIREATGQIGLRINEDETLQSADMLIYGKVIIYRGNLTCLEEKRYSRVTCTTNDQLPSFGNIMSTVATNCLTVAHYSKSPINAMLTYHWLSNFVISLLALHNPALRCSPSSIMKEKHDMNDWRYRTCLIYLDPSLGGISGMCLTRFHIRMFPDPVTEGLAFWRKVYKNTSNHELQRLCAQVGNPQTCTYQPQHFMKLLEDPTSLNLPKGLSAQNLIKSEIKLSLQRNAHEIKHEILQDAIAYSAAQEDRFIGFLNSIEPCFPRFLSEFRASSYFGLADSIVGLFQNSKTIRNYFKQQFREEVDNAIIECELGSLNSLSKVIRDTPGPIWECSSKQADALREKSWGRKIVGTTVPHPAEMIGKPLKTSETCTGCSSFYPYNVHLIGILPYGIEDPDDYRGPYHPYLGSSTNETTSLIQHWEKETDVSFVRKAANMRRALNWFVKPGTVLGKAINQNLESLIGESPGETRLRGKRTGSALHRFACSRVSSGGYIANSYTYGSRMLISTNPFELLGDVNHDFMYQSLLIYSQQLIGEMHEESPLSETYHIHIACEDCLRPIEEPDLDTKDEFQFPDKSNNLKKWKPESVQWMRELEPINFVEGDWLALSKNSQSYEIGIIHGLLFGVFGKSYQDKTLISNLFPITLARKVNGASYLDGLIDGCYRAATLDSAHKRTFYQRTDIEFIITSYYFTGVKKLSEHPEFLGFIQAPSILHSLQRVNHKIPASYPLTATDLGSDFRTFMRTKTYQDWRDSFDNHNQPVWIFSDLDSVRVAGTMIIAKEMSKLIGNTHSPNFVTKARSWNLTLSEVKSDIPPESLKAISHQAKSCKSEVRHAMKTMMGAPDPTSDPRETLVFNNQIFGTLDKIQVNYVSERSDDLQLIIPHIQNPLISGLRAVHLATGAHYKIQIILKSLTIKSGDALCGGDGSGGISALILRTYDRMRVIFNSLVPVAELDLGGSLPAPPSAIMSLPQHMRDRCVNYDNSWEGGSNLAHKNTWDYFTKLTRAHNLHLTLMIFDMEVRNDSEMNHIERQMVSNIPRLIKKNGTVIIKSYLKRIIQPNSLLYTLGALFHNVEIVQTSLSSSNTSEVYLIFNRLRDNENYVIYPKMNEILEFLQSRYCFRSYEDEFKRALMVKKFDLLRGYPNIYKPDPKLEIIGLLDNIGVHSFIIAKYMELFPVRKNNLSTFIMGSVIIAFESMYNTTIWTDKIKNYPSDQKLDSVFAYTIGCLLALALSYKNLKLGETLQSYINQPFHVTLGSREAVSLRELQREDTIAGKWNINDSDLVGIRKPVYLHSRIGLISATLRYWNIVLSNTTQQEPWEAEKYLIRINKSLRMDHVYQHTGLIKLMTKRN